MGTPARIYGSGMNPISWVSFRMSPRCARWGFGIGRLTEGHRIRRTGSAQPVGGGGPIRKNRRPNVRSNMSPKLALLAQFEDAADPLQKSFAGLMLGYPRGDAMNPAAVVETFGIKLTSVNDVIAERVLSKAASAPTRAS